MKQSNSTTNPADQARSDAGPGDPTPSTSQRPNVIRTLGDLSDEELLDAWGADGANGAKAGQELFSRYYSSVYRFFGPRIGPDVTDLVQDVFVECMKGRGGFRKDGSFRGWLFGIARNLLFKHYARQRREPQLASPISEIPLVDLERSPSTMLRHEERLQLMRQALPRLRLDEQILLELHLVERLTGSDLAIAMDIPPNTVWSRVKSAKRRVREEMEALAADPTQLEEEFDTLSDWVLQMQQDGESLRRAAIQAKAEKEAAAQRSSDTECPDDGYNGRS